jgi:lipopolysaccharide export LptBFGC system permease protein LptF
MEKVLNTIKQSCEDLKSRNVINDNQYKTCSELLSKQKWRDSIDEDILRSRMDSFSQKHMDDYNRFKKIIDNSLEALLDAKEDKREMYMKRIDDTNNRIKKRIEEFQMGQGDTSNIFKEFVAKQSIVNKNNKTIKKHNDNIEFIHSKQRTINNQNEIETYRRMIYIVFITLSILMIIIISIVILYYGQKN